MSRENHIVRVLNEAGHNMFAQVKTIASKNMDNEIIKKMFTTQTQVKKCIICWCFHIKKPTRNIENYPTVATKNDLRTWSYGERITPPLPLDLPTLEETKSRRDILAAFEFCDGFSEGDIEQYLDTGRNR